MMKRLLTHPSGKLRKLWKPKMMMMLIAALLSFGQLQAQDPIFASEQCSCLNNGTNSTNGQFEESIFIFDLPGEDWYIESSEGFYSVDSPAPPAAPVAYAPGTLINDEDGDATIVGRRITGTMYSVTISNGIDMFTYESTKLCDTPNGAILGDMNICMGDDEKTYFVDIPGNRIETIDWVITGGGSIVSGEDSEEIEVDWTDAVGPRSVSVSGTAQAYSGQLFNLCDFDGEVTLYVADENSPTLACNGNLNLSINGTCQLTVTPDMILEDMEQASGSYEIEIMDMSNNQIIPGNVIGMEYINQQLQVSVIHNCSSNSCWGFLTIEDKSMPSLECPEEITIDCDDSTEPEDVGFPIPASATAVSTGVNTYTVSGFDGCSDVTLTYNDNVEAIICEGEFASTIIRRWKAEDSSGNVDTCRQTILVNRGTLDDITFPPSYDDVLGVNNSLYACDVFDRLPNGHPDPEFTGMPMGSTCLNVNIQYEDTKIEVCGDISFKVRRRWTVVDLCSDAEPLVRVQTITVEDNRPPVITAPEEFSVGTKSLSCAAEIIVPPVILIDECSEDITVEVTYKLRDESGDPFTNAIADGVIDRGDGSFLIEEVTGDSVWIVYTVTDKCGNQSMANTEVAIVDYEPPVPVCDQNTFVGLAEDGTAYAGWEAFDDGSWDNCELDRIEIRRVEDDACGVASVFGNDVKFCCEDAGNVVMVRLKAIDKAGNENECMVEVRVQDNKDPSFTFCPADRTVDCESNLSNLSIFGAALAEDNCSVTVTESSSEDFNSCGNGTIVRTFTATDNDGNSATCQQTITVRSLSPFGLGNINFPNNYTTDNGCPGSGIAPEMLPSGFDVPVITADPCSQVAVDYEDVVFQYVDGFCFKVLRTWVVFDECQFDPSVPNSGIFSRTQTIQVRNTSAPVFTSGCNNASFTQTGDCLALLSSNTTAEDDCSQQDISYNYEIDLNNDGSVDFAGTGNSFTREVAYGNHKITFFATDECDNTAECVEVIEVRDQKAPTPYCLGEVVTTLGESGSVEIWASDFDNGSYDECIGNTDVTIAFNAEGTDLARTYTCDSLTSTFTDLEIMVFVIDNDGNFDFCTSILKLQDNDNVCTFDNEGGEGERAAVTGNIYTSTQSDIKGVEVMIMDMASETPTYDMTDEIGSYAFVDLSMANDYYVEPNRSSSYLEGVSTLDLVLIQRHILGLSNLDSPYKIIAADINNSETISASDVVQLRKLVLGVYDELPENTSWRFVDAAFNFVDATQPFPYDEKVQIDQLDQSMESVDFIGVKIGDVNGSFESNLAGNIDTEVRNNYAIKTFDTKLSKGTSVSVPLISNTDINAYGLQFTIDYDTDKMTYIGAKAAKLSILDINVVSLKEGQINISYNQPNAIAIDADDLLMELEFVAISNTNVAQAISLSERALMPEVYTGNDAQIYAEAINLEIENRNGTLASGHSFELMQNVPNPFENNTTISFTLPQEGMASLKIFDYTGRLLLERQDEFQQGYNQVEIDITDIEATGILYYQLDTKTHSASKKMIVIR